MSNWKLKNPNKLDSTQELMQSVIENMKSSHWHTGEGEPNDLGKNGDLYLDLVTCNIYKRKNDKWYNEGNIKGKDGRNPLTVAQDPPAEAIEGDLWFDNGLYVLTNGRWVEITGKAGVDGKDGTPVLIGLSSGYLRWRYEDSDRWSNIVAINDLIGPRGPKGLQGEKGEKGDKGEDGREIELQKTDKYIQWRYKGEKWKNLVSLEELKGKIEVIGGGGGGGVHISGIVDIFGANNIVIDKTNPKNPIVSTDFHLTISDTPPASPQLNWLWVDTS